MIPMVKNSQSFRAAAVCGLFVTAALAQVAPAKAANPITVYLSAPKVESSPYSNTTVETFNSLNPGVYSVPYNSSIGTFTLAPGNNYAILADSGGNQQYSAGTGNYLSIGAQSGTAGPLTVHLNSAVSYFGFSWNAGDAANGVTFYNGNTEVGRYTTANTISTLSSSTVKAIDGQTYNSSSYKGQPVTGQDAGEPFGFLNFFDTVGTFDTIVFDNSNSVGSGFEMDNLTILSSANVDSSFVNVGSTSLSPSDPTPSGYNTPEPGSLAFMVGTGFSTLCAFRRRRKA
jgi:hypothetical protein